MTETRKVVILARGLGTRMRKASEDATLNEEQSRAADAGMKAMMPIDRPFLDYCLSAYADAGYTEACLVIGPEHDAVREYYASLPMKRISVTTAIQEEPKGTADAVLAAEQFAAGERFAVVNGDNYYPASVMKAVREADGNATAGFERGALIADSNIPADRIAAFALLVTDEDGEMTDLIEKPSEEELAAHPEAAISMNCFGFTAEVFDAARAVEPSARGELEIIDAVRALARDGGVSVIPVAAGVLDLSRRDDIAAVTERLRAVEVNL